MNNFLNHLDKSERDTLRRKRLNGETLTREENIRLVALEGADQMSDGLLEKYRKGGLGALSQKERDDLAIYLGAYQKVEGDQATRNLILNGSNPSYGYPYAGTRQMQAAYMARMRDQKDGSWDKFWFSPGETANHAAYNQARIDSGLFMNTHPNESFLPSQQALSGSFGDIDAIQNSALAAIGYLGATTLNADPLTRSQFTQMVANLSDVGASFLLPRISLTPGGAFGVTSVGVADKMKPWSVIGKTAANGVEKLGLFDAYEIRLSQKTVTYNKTDKLTQESYTYADLVKSMRVNGWRGDRVDVVKMPDGKLTSMDNTRIAAAREAGIKVQARIRDYNEPLTTKMRKDRGWQDYRTWGEAITARIHRQGAAFRSDNPYGATQSPRITGKP